MNFLKNQPIFNNLKNTSESSIWAQVAIFGIIGLGFIIVGLYISDIEQKDLPNFLSSIPKQVISTSFITLGTIIITTYLMDFLHSSNAFMKIMLDEYNKAIVDKIFLNRFSDKEIITLGEKIHEFHPHFTLKNSKNYEESIHQAKLQTIKLIQDAQHIPDKDRKTERRSKQIYYIKESTHTRTALINGSEISTYQFDLEVLEDGVFTFFYDFSSSNPQNKLPLFEEFTKNISKRFEENSFFADIIKYDGNGLIKDCINCLNVHVIKEDEQEIEIAMIVRDCYIGDNIRLSFSLTMKNEITKELITQAKLRFFTKQNIYQPKGDNQASEVLSQNYTPASRSINPTGIRRVIFQQERYGKGAKVLRLSPSLTIGENQVQPIKKSKSIFYKSIEWKIFYNENPAREVIFHLF